MASQSSIRVRYAETDQMGVAYHGSLLPWFEVGRTDWLRQLNLTYRQIEKDYCLHLAVVEVQFRYSGRIEYDDELTIVTDLIKVGLNRIIFGYEILKEQKKVVAGQTVHACVDPKGKPIRWPEVLKKKFEDHYKGLS